MKHQKYKFTITKQYNNIFIFIIFHLIDHRPTPTVLSTILFAEFKRRLLLSITVRLSIETKKLMMNFTY
jgi:hypothetical protein